MRAAVKQLNYDPSTQEPQLGFEDPNRQTILQGTHLRDIILRGFSPSTASSIEQDNSGVEETTSSSSLVTEPQVTDNRGMFKNDLLIQSWATRYSSPDPIVVEGDPILKDLNPSQIRAIATMISQRFSLIQGPPGTGKTKTIIETVRLLKQHFQIPFPILLCTYTNVAVDNLVEGLVKTGVKPVRVSFGSKVKESLEETTLEWKISAHKLKPDLDKALSDSEAVTKRLNALLVRISVLQANGAEKHEQRLRNMMIDSSKLKIRRARLWGKSQGIQQAILWDIFNESDVVSFLKYLLGDRS